MYSQYGLVEMADAIRVRQLASAPNVFLVRRRRDGSLMQIMLYAHGDDHARRPRRGNPQRDVYHVESEDNPPNVWTFKHAHDSRTGHQR